MTAEGPTRLELVLKDHYSDGFTRLLADPNNDDCIIKGIGLIRDNDISKTDDNLLQPWWNEFVRSTEKFRLYKESPKEGIAGVKERRYLECMLPTLLTLNEGFSISQDEMAESESSRLKAKHKLKIIKLQSFN